MDNLITEKSWLHFFEENKKIIDKILIFLANQNDILPYPDRIFYAFNNLPLKKIKVVIIGQDPYHQIINGEPQATGLAFSVPSGAKIPSSLQNIFKNCRKYKRLEYITKDGDLKDWLDKGIFLLNSSLTVAENKPNSHKKIWKELTDNLIKYLSDKLEKCIFVLWGSDALKKKILIGKKHKIIISSHPSGLSYSKPLGEYPSFSDVDHFGIINDFI